MSDVDPFKDCFVPGCDTPRYVKGMCQAHYVFLREGPACSIEWCNRPAMVKGWCNAHNRRNQLGIDMNKPWRNHKRKVEA